MNERKGQTTAVLLFLVAMIFVALMMMVLSFSETVDQNEYMETYLNSMLISVMRTDSGYTDDSCKLVSDLIWCGIMQPSYQCGGGAEQCHDLATEKVTHYLESFDVLKKNFRYFFRVEPYNFVARNEDGTPIVFEIGDPGVEEAEDRLVASYTIYKQKGYNSYILKAYLFITKA